MAASLEVASRLEKELGLSKQKAEETAKNKTVVENALFILQEVCVLRFASCCHDPMWTNRVMSAFFFLNFDFRPVKSRGIMSNMAVYFIMWQAILKSNV